MHDKFRYLQEHITILLAAAMSLPESKGLEVFSTALEQQIDQATGGAPPQRAGCWHEDLVGWWAHVISLDPTEFALEPLTEKVWNGEVSEKTIWQPEPGEVVIPSGSTYHRRPPCSPNKIPRGIFTLNPQYTLRGTPQKARSSMLTQIDLGEVRNVPTEELSLLEEVA